ncbi:MAG: NHL repeat-containing protein, partial [Verrucomicrobia bacterium]|nr:NHL repeat-containing protein [Verrucomicrobiota bacterium]
MKTIARILRCLRLRPTLVATFPALLLAITPGSLQAQPVVKTLTGGWWQYNTTTFYGNTNGNTFAVAQFNFPSGLALDLSGSTLYVADFTNNTVRQISNLGDITNSLTTTFAGTNKGIWRPVAVAVDSTNGIYVLNRSTNGNTGTVLKFDTAGNLIRTNAAGLTNATALALDSLNNLYVTIKSNTVMRITAAATNYYTITNAGTSLRGITVLDDGRLALTDSGNNGIWLLNPLTTNYTKLTGFHGTGDTNGAAAVAAFKRPEMIAKAGNGILVVADRGSHKVKLVDSLTGYVTNFYGVSSNLWVPGPGTIQNPIFHGWWDGTVTNVDVKGTVEAREPLGVLVAPDGSVYTTEVYYHIIRHVTATGLIGPQPSTLLGIALDAADENLFIADATNNIVRALNFANNQTTTYLDSGDGISYPVD